MKKKKYVQWDITSVIYRLQEDLRPSQENIPYKILIESCAHVKQVRAIEMSLNETWQTFIYSFPIQNCLK
jgi:hypothetical protein